MASKAKKAHLDPTPETPEQTESSSESGSGSDNEGSHDGDLSSTEREIQVEFEARTPEERDITGIISLLNQCLRGSVDVDVSALARYIVNQRSVGSVVTQSHSDSTDDEEDEDDVGTDLEVFGLATIVRLKGSEVAGQIVRYLNRAVATTDPRSQLSRVLSDSNSDVGLIISERIM